MMFSILIPVYMDIPLYYYRENPASVTRNYQKGRHRRLNSNRLLLLTVLKQSGFGTEDNLKQFFICQLYLLLSQYRQAFNQP